MRIIVGRKQTDCAEPSTQPQYLVRLDLNFYFTHLSYFIGMVVTHDGQQQVLGLLDRSCVEDR